MHCIDCGKKLPGDYNKCRKCHSEHSGEKHYCPACGGGNHKMAKTCQHCGKNIEHDYEHILRAPNYDPKKRKTAALLAFFLGYLGLHDRYLGFNKRALSKAIWFCASVAVAIIALFLIRANIELFIPNGQLDAIAASEQAPWTWFFAILIGCGALSAIGCIFVGFFDGLRILTDKSYTDSENQLLI